MNVSLTPELEAMIHRKVASGGYATASEVVREALRVMYERESQLERLRSELQIGIDQLDRGEYVELTPDYFESVKARARSLEGTGHQVRDAVRP